MRFGYTQCTADPQPVLELPSSGLSVLAQTGFKRKLQHSGRCIFTNLFQIGFHTIIIPWG